MGAPAAAPVNAAPLKNGLKSTFGDAVSNNLVFGLVAHAGSGPTWVANALAEELARRKFTPRRIEVSKLIEAVATEVGVPSESHDAAARTLPRAERLQNAGDALRTHHGRRIVAALAIRKIAELRLEAPRDVVPAFIVDSLKHPEEVEALRDVYGQSFYLIGVLCRPSIRKSRLQIKYRAEGQGFIERLIARDEAGANDEGQHVRKTLHLADFFVPNERRDQKDLAESLARFVEIVAGTDIVRPNIDERGMYAAWNASLRSACLSRQVGAAILDASGNVLSTGVNDPPKHGGGLCQEGDAPDHRCFAYHAGTGQGFCRNDVSKQRIYSNVFSELARAGLLSEKAAEGDVRAAIETTRVRDLIEFSRAVHAEMDAIVSVARVGGPSLAGARLYCTTYPCHACARHIVAAGISEVSYIEPYPKSLALTLHRDSITHKLPPLGKTTAAPTPKVLFKLFAGVSPRRFAALFEKRRALKDATGRYLAAPHAAATHNDPIFSKSFRDFEADVAGLLNDALKQRRETEP